MASKTKDLTMLAVGAMFVALVAVVLFAATESPPSHSAPPVPSAVASLSAGDAPQHPLPKHVVRVQQVMHLARRQAIAWRKDARLIRFYATNVAADGRFDRDSSVVQAVFISPRITREGREKNGWRFTLKRAAFGTVEIWKIPAPTLDPRPVRWCPLAPMVGPDAPTRFTLDIHFATRDARPPVALAFTRKPKRWLVGGDPFTCEVHDRSQPRTLEEQREVEARSGLPAGASASASASAAVRGPGLLFDSHAATRRLSAAIAAAQCPHAAGPKQRATVQVTFTRQGRAKTVDFLAGPLDGTAAGQCLRRVLLAVRVRPWRRGKGQAAARFSW